MAALLHAHARHLGEGTIRAGLYAVSWYSAAAPCEDADAVVHGDVFELDPEAADGVMAALDEYEGSDFALREVEVALGETSVQARAYLFAASVEVRQLGHSPLYPGRVPVDFVGVNSQCMLPRRLLVMSNDAFSNNMCRVDSWLTEPLSAPFENL